MTDASVAAAMRAELSDAECDAIIREAIPDWNGQFLVVNFRHLVRTAAGASRGVAPPREPCAWKLEPLDPYVTGASLGKPVFTDNKLWADSWATARASHTPVRRPSLSER